MKPPHPHEAIRGDESILNLRLTQRVRAEIRGLLPTWLGYFTGGHKHCLFLTSIHAYGKLRGPLTGLLPGQTSDSALL